MGFFDKFDKILEKIKLGRNDEIPADLLDEAEYPEESDVILDSFPQDEEETTEYAEYTEEEAPADIETEITDEMRSESIAAFRGRFRVHFPASLGTVEAHMQLPLMAGASFDASAVVEYARNEVYSKLENDEEKLSMLGQAAVAKVAMYLEKHLSDADFDEIYASVKKAPTESLEKTWIVLDFYGKMLKADFTENIGKVYKIVTDEIITREMPVKTAGKPESYEELLEAAAKASAENPDSEELTSLKKALFAKLLGLEKIFVLNDAGFDKGFPYAGADGRIEIQTDKARASALKDYLEGKGEAVVTVEEYSDGEIDKLFDKIIHCGLSEIRLDNGLTPAELDTADLFETGERNLIEVSGRSARGYFLRELQYRYRLENLLADKTDSEEYANLSSAMQKARENGYRALAGSLVYALHMGEGKNGTTLYTPKALDAAREIMKAMGTSDESILIAPGDDGFEAFGEELNLRSIPKRNSPPEEGFVCAFTDIGNAEKIYSKFEDRGVDHAIVAVTLGELCRGSMAYAGFVLDMSSYGLEISKDKFVAISECVKEKGPLVAGKEI
ncbi:MAG: hypothetical protein IKU43_11935 [Clostridia bacterium]|nr:hypothetical protein [Clostridia bacterium]